MILILKKPSELNTERPPVFCRDYIPIMQSSVSMIYSGGGVGKSFLAIRMAIVYVIETGNKVALWLSEDSEGENWFRYSSLVQQDYPQHKKTLDEKITFISTKPVQFTSMHDGNAVLTKEFWQVRLELSLYSVIFFDPLLQFNGGDENSNTHAGVLMGALKEWSGDEDKSLVLIHHASKSKEGGIRPRGAGEWTNGCRSVFSVAKITDRDGELDRNHTNNLTVTLVKDNGLSYVFSNETTGEIEKSLRVFPDYDYESARGASPEPHKLFLSIASHNSAKKPDGFIKVELETFYETHKFVTHDKAYSQYEFKGGYRLGANNQGNITMVCLDFDDGMTIERAKEKFSKVQSLIVTTRSHQIMKSDKKCDRFRVIMPLESPLNIPLSDYPGFLDCLSEATGGEVDPSTKDLARFYFASPKNATYHYSDSDKRLNWR
ncbi:MAG: AAA family ATPase, partial [Desulfocapsa sp.]|nr:AAA family ATPase [Desulfocapsa sp.]